MDAGNFSCDSHVIFDLAELAKRKNGGESRFAGKKQAPVNEVIDSKIDPWVTSGTQTFVELHFVMDEFRCKEVSSSNIYDTATTLIDDNKTQLEIVVVFDRWIFSRNAAITCDNRLDGYRTSIQKITDRYLICQILNVGSPAVIRIDCN